jgi:hypothetical protein
MLDAATQKTMRTVLRQHFMPEVIEVYNVATTLNDFGEATYTRTLALTVSGQHQELTGNERTLLSTLVDAGLENIEGIKVILPYGTAITVAQDVKTADGTFWHVAFVSRTKTYNAAVEVMLITAGVRRAAATGLANGAQVILDVSNQRVPIDEGTLANSGNTNVDEQALIAAVSYDTPYAIRQHEDTTLRHLNGRESKFLERALLENTDVVNQLIADAIKAALQK